MQIVPYMPIHPAQLNVPPVVVPVEDNHENTSSPVLRPQTESKSDDLLFKRPFLPVLYTVEEPSDASVKRPSRMKRSVADCDTNGLKAFFSEVIPNHYDRIVISR